MSRFLPDVAHLHALIGDAVLDVPAPVAQKLERALAQQALPAAAPNFVSHLLRVHHAVGGHGGLWEEPGVTVERNETLAQVSRNLRGLTTVLQLLSAAIVHNRHAANDEQIADHLLQGLVLAGCELTDSATEALHHEGE